MVLLPGVIACMALTSCISQLTAPAPKSSNIMFQVALLNDRVFPDSSIAVENPLLVNPADQKIHLYAAGGETIWLQVVIPSIDSGTSTLQIEPMKLIRADVSPEKVKIKAIDSCNWRIYQVATIPAKEYDAIDSRIQQPAMLQPRLIPDALIEMSTVEPGRYKYLRRMTVL